MELSERASLSNYRCQNRKGRPYRSTTMEIWSKKLNYREAELLIKYIEEKEKYIQRIIKPYVVCNLITDLIDYLRESSQKVSALYLE